MWTFTIPDTLKPFKKKNLQIYHDKHVTFEQKTDGKESLQCQL